uniref:Uncharacterized protein n=1 Tax=Anguilla anguilla TaxID=7936 RepID=A0A0E9U0J0_ANGAN
MLTEVEHQHGCDCAPG